MTTYLSGIASKDKHSMKRELWEDPKSIPYIHISHVCKNFDSTQALKDVSLSIYKGELFSLLGGSGCGKTTLLRILAGFETPSSGKIFIDGVDMSNVPAYERPVNMVFQSYALFPHMTVFQNVAFGLKQERVSKSEIMDRVQEGLGLVQMEKYATRYPNELSGGQRQRVAVARSLVKRPKVLLLDEPMAALDKKLRERTQFELVNLQERVGITFVMVTHDQEEAMTMSSRMAIMEDGRIRQVATPHDVYEFPSCRLVAEFVGSANMFDGIVVAQDEHFITIESPDIEAKFHVSHASLVPIGSSVCVALRPEKVLISKTPMERSHNTATGIVKEIGYLGDMSIYYVQLKESKKIVQSSLPNLRRLSERDVSWDDEVYLYWKNESSVVLTS